MEVARRQNMTSEEGDRMSKILPAGTPAPDFTLHVTPDRGARTCDFDIATTSQRVLKS